MLDERRKLDELKRAVVLKRLKKLGATRNTGVTLPSIVPADRSVALPLSFAQQQLWFLDQLDHAAGAAYHIPVALRLTGQLDRSALRTMLDRIVARHESLRTRFVRVDGEPVQVIGPAETGFVLVDHDLTGVEPESREAATQALVVSEAQAPFDLSSGPLIRGRLLRLGEEEHVLLVTQHHIVSDGWSIGMLVREMSALYTAYSQGQPDPLPALPIQYADYAVWQRQWLQGEVLQTQMAYWRTHLVGAPALLELPTNRPRPAVQRYVGNALCFQLPAGLTYGLRALSQRHGTTLFMTLLAGWSVLLSRLSGRGDLVVGIAVANRQRIEIEPLLGFFANTLALRMDSSDDPSVAECLARTKSITLGAFGNQDLPFEQVVEMLQPVRSLGHNPIFQVMMVLQNAPSGGALELPGLTLEPLDQPHTTTQFDLSLSLTEVAGGLGGTLEYASDLFDATTIARWAGHFETLLRGMVADTQQRVSALPLLTADERKQVLETFNATQANYPSDRTIHALFEAQVERGPEAIAVMYEGESLSYGELNRRANQVAHCLIGLGVKPDERVVICAERSLEMVIGLLGILKAGGAYVPLDPVYPAERLVYMLADSAPMVLLTQSALRETAPALDMGTLGVPVLVLDEDVTLQSQPDHNPTTLGLTSRHLAYVIYTSGSTGRPKGVMVEHANVINLIHTHVANCGLKPSDRMLQFASYSFDNSVEEIFPALSAGATVVLRPAHLVAPDETFAGFLQTHRIDIVDLPTAFWHQWSQEVRAGRSLPGESLRLVIVGGEKIERRYLANWLMAPGTRGCGLLNTYGPTETTVYATAIGFDSLSLLPEHEVPIGRPIANTRVYLLDGCRQPVPVGVVGEIYIGGVQVARGYLNRQDLTAERFTEDPFSTEPGARLYKTGDLGHWLPDGNIEYLGRNDFQVKIRGFRIELGEIEAKLLVCEGVREAVVIAREDTPGDKRLVAYLVPCEGVELSMAALRETLSRELTEYMVPSAFVSLAVLPLTPNGKLDRKGLPAPDQTAVLSRKYEAPVGEIEAAIAVVWQELLGLERVGRHDHFFELGGHSLLAIKLIYAMKARLGASLPLATIFSAQTITALAAMVETGQHPKSLVVPLQTTGQGRPLFCIHPVGGQISFYQALARQLADMFPVYGVQSPEVIGLSLRLDSVEAMAAAYGTAIRAIQPVGPYRLLGWCTGGLIAVAIAKHLAEYGGEVEYLGLMDSRLISGGEGSTENQLMNVAVLAEMRSRGFFPRERWSGDVAFEQKSIKELLSMEFSEAAPYLEKWVRPAFSAETFEHLKSQLPVTLHHLKLLSEFQPSPVEAPLQAFWSGEHPEPGTSDLANYDERAVTAGVKAVATHWVGADHYGMLADPHVQRIGAAIAAFLEDHEALSRVAETAEPAENAAAETIT